MRNRFQEEIERLHWEVVLRLANVGDVIALRGKTRRVDITDDGRKYFVHVRSSRAYQLAA